MVLPEKMCINSKLSLNIFRQDGCKQLPGRWQKPVHFELFMVLMSIPWQIQTWSSEEQLVEKIRGLQRLNAPFLAAKMQMFLCLAFHNMEGVEIYSYWHPGRFQSKFASLFTVEASPKGYTHQIGWFRLFCMKFESANDQQLGDVMQVLLFYPCIRGKLPTTTILYLFEEWRAVAFNVVEHPWNEFLYHLCYDCYKTIAPSLSRH